MNNNNKCSKNNILDKDGLPLAWFCGYLKINNNDLDKIKLLLKENNISFKYEYQPSVFDIEDIAQHRILDAILNFPDNLNNISADMEKDIITCINNLDLDSISEDKDVKEEINIEKTIVFSNFIEDIESIVDSMVEKDINDHIWNLKHHMKGK